MSRVVFRGRAVYDRYDVRVVMVDVTAERARRDTGRGGVADVVHGRVCASPVDPRRRNVDLIQFGVTGLADDG